MSQHAYYAYFDEEHQSYYYFEVFSRKTVWVYPTDGEVVDAETREPFPNPELLEESDSSGEIIPSFSKAKSSPELIPTQTEKVAPASTIPSGSIGEQPSHSSNPMPKHSKRSSTHKSSTLTATSGSEHHKTLKDRIALFDDPKDTDSKLTKTAPLTNRQDPTKMEAQTFQERLKQFQESSQPPPKPTKKPLLLKSTTIPPEHIPPLTTLEQIPKCKSDIDQEKPKTFEASPALKPKLSPRRKSEEPRNTAPDSPPLEHRQKPRPKAPPVKPKPPPLPQELVLSHDILADTSGDPLPVDMVDVPTFDPKAEVRHSIRDSVSHRNRSFTVPNASDRPYLPNDLQADIQRFQVKKYAQLFFQQNRKKSIFRRTLVDLDELVTFSTEPIREPLLKFLPPSSFKNAILCFQLLLQYTIHNHYEAAHQIVDLCYNFPELRDEVFFQLIKQTSECNDKPVLVRTWDLFLIIATIFPSTRDSERWIRCHLMQSAKLDDDPRISTIAQFTYIRYNSRCAVGEPLEGADMRLILEIPMHPKTSVNVFGVSLGEILWGQRRTMPRLPIPYFLHQIVRAILAAGAELREGVFRLPGSAKIIGKMIERSSYGENIFDGADVNDLASLMKRWIRELPDPLIPAGYIGKLVDAAEKHQFIQFAHSLPGIHQMTLAYLIGFLQQMAKAESKTKMGPSNLAVVFGPNIIPAAEVVKSGKHILNITQDFLICLINEWDVSVLYPLPEALILP